MIAILGGGIAGISAGYHAGLHGYEYRVFERNSSYGGLLDNFTVNGEFRFDKFVHLSFAKDDDVHRLLYDNTEFITHEPISSNYYQGKWLKHPAQNNLSPLSSEEKTKIILDFVNRPEFSSPENYKDWLLSQFGNYFTENFPGTYTRKYWTLDAEDLTVDWLGGRFSLPPLEDVLKGAFIEQEKNFYYAKKMRYPKKGGYKSFLDKMVSKTNIVLNSNVELVDLKLRKVEFSDGLTVSYDHLISSIPLPELVPRIKDVPVEVLEASTKLLCTSGQLVSLGFSSPEIAKYLWFYIYDEDILPSRAYSPSLKSPDNAPVETSSYQFETYFSKHKPKQLSGGALIQHVVEKGIKMNLWTSQDISVSDYREVKYANVVFDFERKKNLKIIHNYLDSYNVQYIGRFGEWDYLWSDQSLISGKKKVNELIKLMS
jgi:protoporphyrinogen oxidase